MDPRLRWGFRVPDLELTVSRRHASIQGRSGGSWSLEAEWLFGWCFSDSQFIFKCLSGVHVWRQACWKPRLVWSRGPAGNWKLLCCMTPGASLHPLHRGSVTSEPHHTGALFYQGSVLGLGTRELFPPGGVGVLLGGQGRHCPDGGGTVQEGCYPALPAQGV